MRLKGDIAGPGLPAHQRETSKRRHSRPYCQMWHGCIEECLNYLVTARLERFVGDRDDRCRTVPGIIVGGIAASAHDERSGDGGGNECRDEACQFMVRGGAARFRASEEGGQVAGGEAVAEAEVIIDEFGEIARGDLLLPVGEDFSKRAAVISNEFVLKPGRGVAIDSVRQVWLEVREGLM